MYAYLTKFCRGTGLLAALLAMPLFAQAQALAPGQAQRPFGGVPPTQLPGNPGSPTNPYPARLAPGTDQPNVAPGASAASPGQRAQIQSQGQLSAPQLPAFGAPGTLVPGSGRALTPAPVPGSANAAPQPGQ